MTDRELLQQSLYAHLYHREQTRPIDVTDAVIEALRAWLAQPEVAPLPLVQATAPREIWLQISDDAWDSAEPFPDGEVGITWCQDSVVACEVRYVRADLAAQTDLKHCACEFDGDTCVTQCKLHAAHVDAIHEWAERAKSAEARIAAPAVLEDAKRYQWLRDKFTRLIVHAWPNYDHGEGPCVVREINVSENFRVTDPESTDAAIDAARKAAP